MIIGLASYAPQVGKSTIAKYLESKYNFLYCEMSDPVISMAEKLFGFKDKMDQKQRKILQDLGILGKSIEPDYWLYLTLYMKRFDGNCELTYNNYWECKYKVETIGLDKIFDNKTIVVSGVRSNEELDEILRLGGVVILVRRPSVESNDISLHDVERGLVGCEKFFSVVLNTGTIEELFLSADETINRIQINLFNETFQKIESNFINSGSKAYIKTREDLDNGCPSDVEPNNS